MAAPNYQGEKRRRDLAKQAKKKEKLARKHDKNRAAKQPAADDATAPAPQNQG